MIAFGRPRAKQIARFSVGEQRDIAGGDVVAIELIPFAAANIFGENNVVAAIGVKAPSAHRISEKGKLVTLADGG